MLLTSVKQTLAKEMSNIIRHVEGILQHLYGLQNCDLVSAPRQRLFLHGSPEMLLFT